MKEAKGGEKIGEVVFEQSKEVVQVTDVDIIGVTSSSLEKVTTPEAVEVLVGEFKDTHDVEAGDGFQLVTNRKHK
ncbi:unnamed protein product [Linum trigynum]|uniref:Uncharacterized protein n=1 Tax=Linum trigynum TaxID=586398 RepID=A0AAV2E4N3_9ROSI